MLPHEGASTAIVADCHVQARSLMACHIRNQTRTVRRRNLQRIITSVPKSMFMKTPVDTFRPSSSYYHSTRPNSPFDRSSVTGETID